MAATPPFRGYLGRRGERRGRPQEENDVFNYCTSAEKIKVALEQLEGELKVSKKLLELDLSEERRQEVLARIDALDRKAAELQATAGDKKAAAEAAAKKKNVDAGRDLAEAERKAKIEAAKGGADVAVAQKAADSTKQNVQDLGGQASFLASKDDDDEPELIESPQPPLKKQKTTPKETPDGVVVIDHDDDDDDDAPPPGAATTPMGEVAAGITEVLSAPAPHDPKASFRSIEGKIHAGEDKAGKPTAGATFKINSAPREAAVEDQRARAGLN